MSGKRNTRFEVVSDSEWKAATRRRHADILEALDYLLGHRAGATVKIPLDKEAYKAKQKVVIEYAHRRNLRVSTTWHKGSIYIRSCGSKADAASTTERTA